MTRDKILPVAFEFQRLTIILANKIAQSGLREPDAHTQFGSEGPFQFLREGFDEFGGRGGSFSRPGWFI